MRAFIRQKNAYIWLVCGGVWQTALGWYTNRTIKRCSTAHSTAPLAVRSISLLVTPRKTYLINYLCRLLAPLDSSFSPCECWYSAYCAHPCSSELHSFRTLPQPKFLDVASSVVQHLLVLLVLPTVFQVWKQRTLTPPSLSSAEQMLLASRCIWISKYYDVSSSLSYKGVLIILKWQVTSLSSKENLYLDCCAAFNVDGKSTLTDEQYEQANKRYYLFIHYRDIAFWAKSSVFFYFVSST